MNGIQRIKALKLALEESNKELKEILNDMGKCDHEANYCCCGLRNLVESNDNLLKAV